MAITTEEAFSEAWVGELVKASAGRKGVEGVSGIVGLGTGKKPKVVVEIAGGEIKGTTDAEAEVVFPISADQIEAWNNGELALSVAYMKGDLKPVGSTGAILAALEVLDNL